MLDYYALSDKGGRENNEDYFGEYIEGDYSCFIVADGLGGHGGGEIASKTVVDNVIEYAKENIKSENFVPDAIMYSQKKLIEKQKGSLSGMKSTIALLFINKNKATIGFVGDSRVYCFCDGKMLFRTLDHSVPQTLVKAGKIHERKIRKHPDRNRLLRVMGNEWETPAYELIEDISLKNGMSFLICSDGFWEYVIEKDMISGLKKTSSAKEWSDVMMKKLSKRCKTHSNDNYTLYSIIFKE